MAGRCKSCGEAAVVSDSTTEDFPVCAFCGVIQSLDIFHHQAFDSAGNALGSIVAPSHSSPSSAYRELKLFRAERTISDFTSLLSLSPQTSSLVRRLVQDVVGPDLGAGRWFDVLVAACSVLAARLFRIPLSISEVSTAAAIDDSHELARMVSRVSRHLSLGPLPSFDLQRSLDRCLRSSLPFLDLDPSKSDHIHLQATFLLTCCLKWSLSSGRQPLPLVAAVAAFVAESNGVTSATIDGIAKDIHATPSTARLRKKEIERTLVDVARKLLPWGNDVTTKNISQHARVLLRYMEIRSNSGTLDLGTFSVLFPDDDASDYRSGNDKGDRVDGIKLSADRLSSSSKEAMETCELAKDSAGFGKDDGRRKKRRSGLEIETRMAGGLKEEVSPEQIGGVDVGYDVPPPAFVMGLKAKERRREKIRAARARILEIAKPVGGRCLENVEIDGSSSSKKRKRRRKGVNGYIDWEDCVIEMLLLHGVEEEEIEEGYYKRLLDLHVFNCLDARKVRSLQALLRKAKVSAGRRRRGGEEKE